MNTWAFIAAIAPFVIACSGSDVLEVEDNEAAAENLMLDVDPNNGDSLILPGLPGNFLKNGGFELSTAGVAPGTATSLIHESNGPFAPGNSAAANWTTWLNQPGQILTWLSSDNALSGVRSLLVSAGASHSGIVQHFAPTGTVTNAGFRVNVFVLHGQVFAAIGDGGSTGLNPKLSDPAKNGQWQTLSTCGFPNGKNNEAIVYAYGGPALYYVDRASLSFSGCAFAP